MSLSNFCNLNKLILDIGNTLTKAAVYNNKDLLALSRHEQPSYDIIHELFEEYAPIGAAILSTVRAYDDGMLSPLRLLDLLIELDENTPVPVEVSYRTPDTLGKDRLAAVCGAAAKYPGKNVLVIDAGTALTFDFLTSGKVYLGGSISPGINLRFKALHTFTGKLPLVQEREPLQLTGNDTATSIISGVINGAVAEVQGMIEDYRNHYPDVSVIITGGDATYFDKKLKSDIFAHPNLVLDGLNEILDWNRHKK